MKHDKIIKRVLDRIQDKQISDEDIKDFKDNVKSYKNITHILIEDYNLPEFFWRIYNNNLIGNITYHKIVEDYFSDCEQDLSDIMDLGLIYDVEKDKFVKVQIKTEVLTVEQ